MTLRLSVITPSFNQAAFLEQTLRSVLDQNYPDLEYWVIDGASTDGSLEIIQQYAPRLAGWVSEPDHGQAEAINKGFARASGDVVAWINSDDYYLPGAFAAATAAFERDPDLALLFSDVRSVNGAGETINVMRYGEWGLDDLLRFNIIGQPGVFMRRSALERAGGLDLSYHYLLDHQLWLRLAQQGAMRHDPAVWAAARFHADAKNVAHAARFGEEAHRIVAWALADPALGPRARGLERQMRAGAHRMDGRYLLDGGQPRAALAAYGRSLWNWPPTALPEWRRMAFAAVSLVVNVDALRARYLARRKQRAEQAER